jgi:hypothetical protein
MTEMFWICTTFNNLTATTEEFVDFVNTTISFTGELVKVDNLQFWPDFGVLKQ